MQEEATEALSFAPGQAIEFDYVNWRGEHARRRASPISLRHGATEWHPEPQLLLLAADAERGAHREFAVRDMAPTTPADLRFAEGQPYASGTAKSLLRDAEGWKIVFTLPSGEGSVLISPSEGLR